MALLVAHTTLLETEISCTGSSKKADKVNLARAWEFVCNISAVKML